MSFKKRFELLGNQIFIQFDGLINSFLDNQPFPNIGGKLVISRKNDLLREMAGTLPAKGAFSKIHGYRRGRDGSGWTTIYQRGFIHLFRRYHRSSPKNSGYFGI